MAPLLPGVVNEQATDTRGGNVSERGTAPPCDDPDDLRIGRRSHYRKIAGEDALE
jgi:hypothetical protein